MNTIKIKVNNKEYVGTYEYCGLHFHGRCNIPFPSKDIVTFQSNTLEGLESEFTASINDYLDWCHSEFMDRVKVSNTEDGWLRRYNSRGDVLLSIKVDVAKLVYMDSDGFPFECIYYAVKEVSQFDDRTVLRLFNQDFGTTYISYDIDEFKWIDD